jgi:hypothetical protein
MGDQELIHLLKQQAKEIADANITGYGNTMTEAANRLEQLVSLPSREWVEFNKQRPPLNEGIIVTDGKGVTVCELERWETRKKEERFSMCGYGFGGYEWEFDFEYENITKWMPLPKP